MAFGAKTARTAADLRQGLSKTDEGVGVDVDGRLVSVNMGGAVQVMPWKGGAPWVGDTVAVDYLGQKPRAISVYGSPQGTVVSADSDVAVVTGDDGVTYAYPFLVGYTPSAGHRVALLHSHRLVIGQYTDDPAGSAYELPEGPPTGPFTKTFYPIDSAGWRFGNVYQGANVDASASKSGAYFYGTQLRDSLVGRTVTSLLVNLGSVVFDYFPGVNTPLGYHGESGYHGGSEPAFAGAVAVTGGGVYDITGFAAAFQSGAAYGVGFASGSGQRQFGSYSVAGAITATGT